MDLTTITSAIGTAKTALEIAKAVKGIEDRYKDAELKSKVTDLLETLINLKENLIDVKNENIDLREEIKTLKARQEQKDDLIKVGNKYFSKTDTNKENPYCLTCWDKDNKLIHLRNDGEVYGGEVAYQCNVCKNYD